MGRRAPSRTAADEPGAAKRRLRFYHQRPDRPLQRAWRASRMRPGAQVELVAAADFPSVASFEAEGAVGDAVAQASIVVDRKAVQKKSAIQARGLALAFGLRRVAGLACMEIVLSLLRIADGRHPFPGRFASDGSPDESQEECQRSWRWAGAPGRLRRSRAGSSARSARRVAGSFPLQGARLLSRALGAVLAGLVAGTVPAPASAQPLHGYGHRAISPRSTTRPARPRVSAESDSALRQWLGGERLTGEWLGARGWLRDRGVDFEGSYIGDLSRPLRGGLRERTNLGNLVDLNARLDLEKLVGLPGATIFADAYAIFGDFATADVGDFQYFSNIENPNDRHQLAELWWQQTFFGSQLRLKFGKFDGNSEFAFVDAAGDFVNSSAGMSPTIFPMTTYPDPAMGALAFYDPEGPFYAGVGLFDGAAATGAKLGKRGPKTFFRSDSDLFVIGEVGGQWDAKARFGPGRVAAGPWYQSAQFDRFDGSTAGDTAGFYALFEQRLFALEPEREEGTRDVRLFGQYGWADADVSAAAQHVSGGLLVTGPFAFRSTDTTGAMVSWVDLSDRDGAGFPRNETSVELFYRAQLTPFFSLKPDLQIIDDPGGVQAPTAVVGTLRFEINL